MFIRKKHPSNWWYFGRRFRLHFEPNWRSRPYPYWFNAKYGDAGLKRRICIPFYTFDIIAPKR